MNNKFVWLKLIFFNSLLVICPSAFATVQYELVLDTSSQQGIQAVIAYDLIDGSPGNSIINIDRPKIDGITFSSTKILEDLSFYNTFEQPITLGNELILGFSLFAGGVPGAGFFPDSFSVFLLDTLGMPLFLTNDPTGANSLVQWDIGYGAPTAFDGVLNATNSNTVSATVPEPGSLVLAMIALLGLWLQKKRRYLSIILSGLILTHASAALSAPSLDTSTDLGVQSELKASGLRLNRQTNTYDSLLTITNKSQTNLDKPFTVAVLSLPNGVILSNATAVSDEGVPLITVDTGPSISAGSNTSLTLKFVNRSNLAFPLSLRLVRLDQPVPELAMLLGPDANGNGVRDDLEPILDTRYTNTPERNAAIQALKAMRNGLGATSSVETAFSAIVSLNKSLDCIFSLVGSERGATESEFLRDQVMNTRERIAAWIAFNDKVAGQSVQIGTSNACEAQ